VAEKSASQRVQRGGARFDGKMCGVCHAPTRKLDKRQWWICMNGHRLVRKGS